MLFSPFVCWHQCTLWNKHGKFHIANWWCNVGRAQSQSRATADWNRQPQVDTGPNGRGRSYSLYLIPLTNLYTSSSLSPKAIKFQTVQLCKLLCSHAAQIWCTMCTMLFLHDWPHELSSLFQFYLYIPHNLSLLTFAYAKNLWCVCMWLAYGQPWNFHPMDGHVLVRYQHPSNFSILIPSPVLQISNIDIWLS